MKIWNELTQFRSLGIIVPLVDLMLRERGYEASWLLLVVIAIIGFFVVWCISIIWDKAHLTHYETDFGNLRNPMEMKKLQELRKIRQLMEKFK